MLMGKIGYNEVVNERGDVEKSNDRRTVFIASLICVFVTVFEGATQIISMLTAEVDEKVIRADWQAVAMLCAVLLAGTGVVKGAQRINKGGKNV
jgi:heme/copper-type cytochrome/quinol oxidase subunit 3